jgi:hypothetical protein
LIAKSAARAAYNSVSSSSSCAAGVMLACGGGGATAGGGVTPLIWLPGVPALKREAAAAAEAGAAALAAARSAMRAIHVPGSIARNASYVLYEPPFKSRTVM